MKNRYRLLYRGERGTFFCFDNVAHKRTGLCQRSVKVYHPGSK